MPELRYAPPAIGDAFAGNRLLNTFPEELRRLVEEQMSLVELEQSASVLRRGTDVGHSLFPFGTTMISLVVDLDDGRSVEVASIGREGAVGGIVSCGHAPAFTRADVMVAGPAARVPMAVIEEAKARSAHQRKHSCRYSDYLRAQILQTLACNSVHPIEASAARALGANDVAEELLDPVIAFARPAIETFAVMDLDDAAAGGDQPFVLKLAGDGVDRGPLHAKQPGQ